MIAYPTLFPCPSRVEGHSAQLGAGLVRTPMNAGNSRQRRAHRNVPHRIALVFVVHQPDYAAWLTWVNTNAWDDWISMRLPGLEASRAGLDTTAISVRFCSDLATELLPVHRLWYWRVRVEAEYIPTPEQLLSVPFGPWVVAGSPSAPPADWIVAGTPPAPSAATISAGTVLAPSALA